MTRRVEPYIPLPLCQRVAWFPLGVVMLGAVIVAEAYEARGGGS